MLTCVFFFCRWGTFWSKFYYLSTWIMIQLVFMYLRTHPRPRTSSGLSRSSLIFLVLFKMAALLSLAEWGLTSPPPLPPPTPARPTTPASPRVFFSSTVFQLIRPKALQWWGYYKRDIIVILLNFKYGIQFVTNIFPKLLSSCCVNSTHFSGC